MDECIRATRRHFRRMTSLLLVLLPALVSAQESTPVIENTLGMKLVLIPAGTFIMGSPFEEAGRQEDELPHPVTISRAFYLASTEVTQAQWSAVMGSDKSFFKGPQLPMEKVSWQEAVLFCQKLSDKEGRVYRLPTEAEWEYACRAGRTSASVSASPLADLAWYSDNSDETTHPVGLKEANGWGLFDMLGNVSEWVADYYDAEYPAAAVTDPKGPEKGTYRVMRGGSWASFAMACRCTARSDAPAAYQLKQTGFRVVLEVSSR